MTAELIIDFEGKKYRIQVNYDEKPLDVRTDYDNLGIMYCSHPKYNLGDEQVNAVDKQIAEELCWEKHNKMSSMGVFEQLAEQNEAVVWLPLSLLDHGGLKMFVGDSKNWDIGPVGIIYTTKEKIKMMGCEDWDEEKLKQSLEAEVETYSHTLEGTVFRYSIEIEREYEGELCCEKAKKPAPTWELHDSCGSFIGYPDESGIAYEIASTLGLYDRDAAPNGPVLLKSKEAEIIFKQLKELY